MQHARPGASAYLLAQTALEYFFYEELFKHEEFKHAQPPVVSDNTFHALSPVETQRAFQSLHQ
jgi:hypothetical protein